LERLATHHTTYYISVAGFTMASYHLPEILEVGKNIRQMSRKSYFEEEYISPPAAIL
jgi:hypothetical protein